MYITLKIWYHNIYNICMEMYGNTFAVTTMKKQYAALHPKEKVFMKIKC